MAAVRAAAGDARPVRLNANRSIEPSNKKGAVLAGSAFFMGGNSVNDQCIN
ncbi:MAG: hypothetical protein RLZZ227_683 [Pseudomonadota bacterium]